MVSMNYECLMRLAVAICFPTRISRVKYLKIPLPSSKFRPDKLKSIKKMIVVILHRVAEFFKNFEFRPLMTSAIMYRKPTFYLSEFSSIFEF